MLNTICFSFTAAAAYRLASHTDFSDCLVGVTYAACLVWSADVRCRSGMSLIAMFVLGLSAKLRQLTAVALLVHASPIGCMVMPE